MAKRAAPVKRESRTEVVHIRIAASVLADVENLAAKELRRRSDMGAILIGEALAARAKVRK